jgi:hypothetical protein
MNHKQTRAEKIKALIQSAAKKAGSKDLDLTRKEVENLHQKTYKEFIESVTPRLGTSKSYGDTDYQEKLQRQRKEEQQQKEQDQEKKAKDLYKERTKGRGIRATNKEGKKGWIKDGKFSVGDW